MTIYLQNKKERFTYYFSYFSINIPRKNEYIFLRNKKYKVTDVIHNIENDDEDGKKSDQSITLMVKFL